MQYQNKTFEAIIATPGCGKSYLCDKYPTRFVDVDEERLRCKYVVPDHITREELEKTKGNRPYPKRQHTTSYVEALYQKLDQYVAQGKTLIAAPHGEAFSYFESRHIPFCFVYPKQTMKEEIIRRLTNRHNPKEMIENNANTFDQFYVENTQDKKAVVHYEFDKNEYLEDIITNQFHYDWNTKK